MTENEIQELKSRFGSSEMLDITTNASISLGPELMDFLGGSDMSLADLLFHGLHSLKKGFYIIIEAPFYATELSLPTFSAKVLYLKSPSSQLVKYLANIGPMANVCKRFNGEDPLMDEFEYLDDTSEFRYISKKALFKKIYHQNKIFEITASKFCERPELETFKEVHWNFIT